MVVKGSGALVCWGSSAKGFKQLGVEGVRD